MKEFELGHHLAKLTVRLSGEIQTKVRPTALNEHAKHKPRLITKSGALPD
jgi:hypothetical protein